MAKKINNNFKSSFKCSKARFKNGECFCASTHVCYRSLQTCPLTEYLYYRVLAGSIQLRSIMPMSFREAVQNFTPSGELSLNF